MVSNNQAEIEFIAKENVTEALDKIKSKINSTSSAVSSDADSMKKKIFDLGQTFNSALGFTAANVITTAANFLKNFFVDATKNALLFEQQLLSLQYQTENTADALINKLSVAVNGLVSDLDLAQATNRALVLGLRKDDLPGLFEAAATRAKVMGISVTQATNDIVTGIGRASPLILDNLGIVFDTASVFEQYAASINRSVESLSKQEKAVALTNAVIDSTAPLVEALNNRMTTNIDNIERGKVAWKNFTTDVGNFFASIIGYFADTSTEADRFYIELGNLQKQLIDGDPSTVLIKRLSDVRNEIAGIKRELSDTDIYDVTTQKELNSLEIERLRKEREIRDLQSQRVSIPAIGGGQELVFSSQDQLDALNQAKSELSDINDQITTVKSEFEEVRLTNLNSDLKGIIDKYDAQKLQLDELNTKNESLADQSVRRQKAEEAVTNEIIRQKILLNQSLPSGVNTVTPFVPENFPTINLTANPNEVTEIELG